MIVLDTNVIAEIVRSQPSEIVIRWFHRQNAADLFTTAVSLGEMLFGLALLPPGRRRAGLEQAIQAIFRTGFGDRLLSFDEAAARAYADFASERRRSGRPVALADAQIAGIAIARGAKAIATRNVRDFEGCNVQAIDPWTIGGGH